ncbi:hypothetical protein IF1G_06387 [Cordyceps javanica]|uniref:Uncharacterized protein n=1 Tax=Cordyceps javanica TaxID=43265 RepID=A0A545V102_9HYPO|nr:hypothetical protein IF1G_06387 [Cordyceps javanica]TQW02545.1 hypothetical protein IF2G_09936 [Cordyceps javanica]
MAHQSKLGGLLKVAQLATYISLACATASFPTYQLASSKKFTTELGADIAASSFVGADGNFHFITSLASYAAYDDGSSFTKTFTGDDFGELANSFSSETPRKNYDSYWNKPGSMCYQLDKRATNPMPSLYQDDHCDIVGVWIDPESKDWLGIVNDEYQFNPWLPTGQDQNSRIHTGRHNNRVMLAKSSDQGTSWEIVDQICTDRLQPNQTVTEALFPNTTFSYGLSGTRLYIDYIHGYAYALYNSQVREKKSFATIATVNHLARAPLRDGLAPSTWRKYYNGRWDQPGIGGIDGTVGDSLGLQLIYIPGSDHVAFEGTGADGKAVKYQATPFARGGNFTFFDGSGTEYSVDTAAKTIRIADTGKPVPVVSYLDAALNRTITIGQGASNVVVNSTDRYGVSASYAPVNNHYIFRDTVTGRLYVPTRTLLEAAFTYNVYSGKYRSVSYDNYVYENDDLGRPDDWVPVGQQPEEVGRHLAYTSVIDTGSLTNQNVGSITYSVISDLHVTIDTITQVPHTANQSSYSVYRAPKDSSGNVIESDVEYKITVGTSALDLGSGNRWYLEPIKDTHNAQYVSGFYRLRHTATSNGTSQYLQVFGDTAAQARKLGATVALGPPQKLYDVNGRNGYGSPGGSDQWYILPFGSNINRPLDSSSSQSDVDKAQRTSLLDVAGAKLVNRNSGLVLGVRNGNFELAFNSFAQNEEFKFNVQKN